MRVGIRIGDLLSGGSSSISMAINLLILAVRRPSQRMCQGMYQSVSNPSNRMT